MKKFFAAISDFFEMIFFSAAENQILQFHKGKDDKKYGSYTQLKKHQKRIRRFSFLVFLGVLFFFVGTVIGPALFPKTAKTEVYIPNGRGDILISNVSKSQVTLIFKTLDAENDYKPLATKAYVEVCEDVSCKKIIRRTNEDDYAVTHIIPVDSLKEDKEYFFRLTASDSSVFSNPKSVTSWGDGHDPIKVLTSGELPVTPVCIQPSGTATVNVPPASNTASEDAYKVPGSIYESEDDLANETVKKPDPSVLTISNVQNENYLQPKNRIQTIVSWNTNIPSSSILLYSEGEKGEEVEFVASKENQLKHAAILTTLKAGTIYYFKVKSIDAKGSMAVSEEYSLHTPKPKETVLQAIADNFEALMYQIKPE